MNNLTIPAFLEAAASDSPVPGGGSVSALCGALGAALGTMVCRLTTGRKKYADHEERIRELLDRLNPLIDRLNRAIERDSAAYNQVMNAYKLPKETDEQRSARKAAIGAASVEAATVPMEVAEMSLEALRDVAPLATIGNVNAVTDVGVAAMCLQTAVLGACLNVRINLPSTGDAAVAADLQARCDDAEKAAREITAGVYALVMEKVTE